MFKTKNFWYISLFALLYLITAGSSFVHAISFFGLANNSWMSLILAFAFELGQAVTLFSLLTSQKDRNRIMPWVLMTMFTIVQVIGNVFSSYKHIITNSVENLRYFKEPIFIWTDLPDQEATVIVTWAIGAILPIAALLITSMITNYLTDIEEDKKESTFLNTEGDSLLNQNSMLQMENQGLTESNQKKDEEIEQLKEQLHQTEEGHDKLLHDYTEQNKEFHQLKEELKSKQELIDLQNQKINDLDEENQELVKEKFDKEPEKVLQQEFSIPTKSIEFNDEQNKEDLNKENEQGEDKLDNEGQRHLETTDEQTEKTISETPSTDDEEQIKEEDPEPYEIVGEDTNDKSGYLIGEPGDQGIIDENIKVADALMGGNILTKHKKDSHFINNTKK